ncbi:S-adenosyl-L-methionine-dependent methyltransferase [Penicillium fimorum]|uniref:phosphoethanolamine N-methyltransferase n=1 Tax=Penicillium fimorum TaxID=1882269 RepID=A0A9X0C195_9EURO|nr:S-adenosyl-L-methionine-dependent methyltransferase [Penicillium fimorum]
MTFDAESIFNDLAAGYEAAFANNPTLRAFVHQIANALPPNSRVLDIGCGTGKPVAEILAREGHDVHGIDISASMVKIAQSQVPGTYEVANMKTFNPPKPYDGACAILSLFQLTPGELYSLMFKFSEWIKVGGYLAIGVTPSTSLQTDKCSYDPTWDCLWMIDKLWMGTYTNELFYSENGWARLLQSAGFVIETEPINDLFCPTGPQLSAPESHYYVLARKIEAQPLLGPYPFPMALISTKDVSDVNLFTDRLVSKDLEALFKGLADAKKVLALGQATGLNGYKSPENIQVFSGNPKRLPFPAQTFDTVLASWVFYGTAGLEQNIQELIRITKLCDSQIMILQGAPGNEAVMHLNAIARSRQISHQGHILKIVARHLEKHGFGDISLSRIRAHYEFPEKDLTSRCAVAAKSLVDLWHKENPQYNLMKEALASRMKLHFQGHAHSVGNEMVVLVAKSSNQEK